MKKLFTSVMMLLFATSFAFAQDEALVRFVDAAGNVYADGSVIDITEGEDDGWGGMMFPTGLYVENIAGEPIYVGISFNVMTLPDKSSFQICFPVNCMNISKTGVGKTPEGELATDEKKSIMAEWMPEEKSYGKCSVDLQVNVYTYNAITKKYNLDEAGPKVTVNMIYQNPASVKNLENEVKAVARYNAAGQQISGEQQGLNIVKLDNGKAVKVVNK